MPKETSFTELNAERAQIAKRHAEIIDALRKETRDATPAEAAEMREAHLRLQEIAVELQVRKCEDYSGATPIVDTPKPAMLIHALRSLKRGEAFSAEVAAMHKRGCDMLGDNAPGGGAICVPVQSGYYQRNAAAEQRSTFVVNTQNLGGELVATDFMNILPALRDRLVLAQAGSTVMTGLTGNIMIPDYSGSQVFWEGEIDPAKDGGGTFGRRDMSPKRLTAYLTISEQLLIQNDLNAEGLLRADLVKAVAGKLQATLLGNADHADKVPDGLFTAFAGAAKEISWGSLVGLETQIDLQNAEEGNLSYVMHTQLFGAAKRIPKFSNSPLPIMDSAADRNTIINGYNALRTNAVATKTPANAPVQYGIVFANWEDFLIGQWGALDIRIDPFTGAKNGVINLIVNSYWDATPRRDASFAKAYMTLPANMQPTEADLKLLAEAEAKRKKNGGTLTAGSVQE